MKKIENIQDIQAATGKISPIVITIREINDQESGGRIIGREAIKR